MCRQTEVASWRAQLAATNAANLRTRSIWALRRGFPRRRSALTTLQDVRALALYVDRTLAAVADKTEVLSHQDARLVRDCLVVGFLIFHPPARIMTLSSMELGALLGAHRVQKICARLRGDGR